MKQLFFGFLLLLSIGAATAQKMVGLQAGVNFASLKGEPSNRKDYYRGGNTGFIVGAIADIPLIKTISFRPEMNFIQKGYKEGYTSFSNGNPSTTKTDQKIDLNYIQLSPNFVYNISVGRTIFFMGAGPEFAYGIVGKLTGREEINPIIGPMRSNNLNEQIKFGKYGEYKTFDFGLNLLGGFKMANRFFFSTCYTAGLANISNYAPSYKNSGFHIKLGYILRDYGV